ncbi:MAG: hypothetical protein WAW31_12950 [Smithella sp.]
MKKLFFGTLLLALVFVLPAPTMARVSVNVGISLPPIVFPGPPQLVVIPETNVYAVPDVDADIFFYGGWWWRPWEGQWYRSREYDSGWGHYRGRPSFYRSVHSGWRNDYRENRWRGREWNQQRVPHDQVKKNWRTWEKNKHWKKQNNWGVRDSRNDRKRSQQQQQGNHGKGRK